MALTDLLKPKRTSAAPGITCPKFERGEGKRCAHYLPNGACDRPDELMCIEWLKANGHAPRATPSPLTEVSR